MINSRAHDWWQCELAPCLTTLYTYLYWDMESTSYTDQYIYSRVNSPLKAIMEYLPTDWFGRCLVQEM